MISFVHPVLSSEVIVFVSENENERLQVEELDDPSNEEDLAYIDNLTSDPYWMPGVMSSNYSSRYPPCYSYSVDEMLAKKQRWCKASSAQLFFTTLIRDAAAVANIWENPPLLSELTQNQRDIFFTKVFERAPLLVPKQRDVWKRLGECLQNRRKYLLDKQTGKRN